MSPKEYLRQYIALERTVKAKEEKIRELKAEAANMGVTLGEHVQTSPDGEKMARIIETYVDMIADQDSIAAERRAKLREIERVISAVDDPRQRELLELRYINGCTFKQVATKMNYNVRQILRIHGEALNKIEGEI